MRLFSLADRSEFLLRRIVSDRKALSKTRTRHEILSPVWGVFRSMLCVHVFASPISWPGLLLQVCWVPAIGSTRNTGNDWRCDFCWPFSISQAPKTPVSTLGLAKRKGHWSFTPAASSSPGCLI